MKTPWFRCFPSNFLAGTRGMRPILHKTYTRLLMGMYEFGGPLPMEARQLGHLLELRPQDVRGMLYELAEAGKIEIKDGFVHNKRTDHELSRWASNGGSNGGSIGAPVEGSMDAPVGSHSDENPNENPTRAGDHTRARRAPATHFIEGGAPPFDQAQRAALPTSTVSSSASEARAEIGYASASQPAARSPAIGGHSLATPTASVNGDDLRRRRTSEWDMPPAPGPIGQTKFLQAEAAFKDGDLHALDPRPGIPWASSNPALSAKIRTQLGLPLPEDNHETYPPADQDDHGFAQRHERAPDPDGSEADQEGPRDGDTEAPPADLAAKHADPRNPNDESKQPLSDDFFGGLP
jgi:hypothetical protein